MDIPIKNLRLCPIQLRTVLKNTLDYRTTLDSIRDLGIITPLLVRPVEDYYEVINGFHRYEIALDLRFQTVPCHVMILTDADVRLAQLADHENRTEPKPAEVYRRLWKIIKVDGIKTLNELATHLRWHPDKVRRTMRLVRLCLRAQKDLANGDLSISIAMELCKLPAGLQDDLMDLAGSMPNSEYKELIRKETRHKRYGGRGGHTGTLDHRFRPLREVEHEYITPTVAASVLAATGAKTPLECFNAGVGWSIKADPASKEQDKFETEQRAAKEAARLKRRIDQSLTE